MAMVGYNPLCLPPFCRYNDECNSFCRKQNLFFQRWISIIVKQLFEITNTNLVSSFWRWRSLHIRLALLLALSAYVFFLLVLFLVAEKNQTGKKLEKYPGFFRGGFSWSSSNKFFHVILVSIQMCECR